MQDTRDSTDNSITSAQLGWWDSAKVVLKGTALLYAAFLVLALAISIVSALAEF